MAQKYLDLGLVKGDKGDTGSMGQISSVTVAVDKQSLEQPTGSAEVGGVPGAQTISFSFQGLKGPKGDTGTPGTQGPQGDAGKDAKIISATATADNLTSESPTVSVDVGGDAGAQTLAFTLSGFKGAKGDRGDAGPAGPAGTNATTTETATQSANGLMSSADKKKLDDITGGAATSVVLANGTTISIATLLQNNIETIRTALGVATKEKNGLVPKLPQN